MPAILHIVATVALLHFAFQLGMAAGMVLSQPPEQRRPVQDLWVQKNAMGLGRDMLVAIVAGLALVLW